jgi:streptogramin lyase
MRLRAAAGWLFAATVALALGAEAVATPAVSPTVNRAGNSWLAEEASVPGAALVYVATNGCDCVTIYSQTTRKQVGSIVGLNGPLGITTAPDGTLWVCVKNAVEAFAPGTTKPSLTIPLGAQDTPVDVAVSPDEHVFVTIATFNGKGGNAIDVFAPGATKPSSTIDLKRAFAGNVSSLTFDKAGNLYVTGTEGSDQGRIAEIPVGTSNAVVQPPILANPNGIVVDSQGMLLVADFDDATTYVLRPGAAQPLRYIGALRSSNPMFVALDGAETRLYVGDALTSKVDIYDRASGTLEATLPAAGGYGTYIGVATSPRPKP